MMEAIMAESIQEKIGELILSPERTKIQREFANSLLPPEILHNPEMAEFVDATLNLASSALKAVEEQYGYDWNSPKFINGEVEKDVLATYHCGTHTRKMMMTDSLAYARMCRLYDGLESFSDEDLVLLIYASAMHDIIQGNGRGNDELQSAELARELMRQSDYLFTEEQMDKVYYAIAATKFDPEKKTQSVDSDKPHVHMQNSVAIGDLLTICRPHGPVHGIAYAVEDFLVEQSTGKYKQVLKREAEKYRFDFEGRGLRDCLEFIDSNDVLREKFSHYLKGQSVFYRNHKYPDPRVDKWFPFREANAQFCEWLAEKYEHGELSAVQVFQVAEERATVLAA